MATNSLLWVRCDTGAQLGYVSPSKPLHLVKELNGLQCVLVASNPPMMVTAPRGYVQTFQMVSMMNTLMNWMVIMRVVKEELRL